MFKAQVSSDVFFSDFFYATAAIAVIVGIIGLGFVDSGLSRSKNVLDSWVQKLVAGFCAALGFVIIGYALWQWQFNTALGIKSPLAKAISGWWLGGTYFTHFAASINPASMPDVDELQVFGVFFITFAMLVGAFFQSAGLERLKPIPLYIMSFVVCATSWPLLTYLAWGSASPLTARGLHDFTGIFNLYIFVGAWSVCMAWRLGPRLGAFSPHPRTSGPQAHNLSHVAIGVLLLMFAIPFIALGSGYAVPGSGYFGITLTSSGFGIVLVNIFAAYIGGGLTGAVIAHRTRNPIWICLGPLAGYIVCSALADFAKPWECLLISILGPVAAYMTQRLILAARIDDPKIGPLALGPGIVGALMAGLVGWGIHSGGYFGITKGTYAFQHGTINVGWQAIGVAITIVIAVGSALIMTAILGRFGSLRISEADELAGLDTSAWGISSVTILNEDILDGADNLIASHYMSETDLEQPHA
jgi:ammonium transporter, Amt family